MPLQAPGWKCGILNVYTIIWIKKVVDILVKIRLKALAILFMALGQLILVLSVPDSLGPTNVKALLTLKSG